MKKLGRNSPIGDFDKEEVKKEILKFIRGRSVYLSDIVEHIDAPSVLTVGLVSCLNREGVLDDGHRKKEGDVGMKELLTTIHEISEKTWCSTWMDDIEFILWDAVQKGEDFEYGGSIIKKWELMKLQQLSEEHGYWVMATDKYGIIFLRIEEWEKIFKKQKKKGD